MSCGEGDGLGEDGMLAGLSAHGDRLVLADNGGEEDDGDPGERGIFMDLGGDGAAVLLGHDHVEEQDGRFDSRATRWAFPDCSRRGPGRCRTVRGHSGTRERSDTIVDDQIFVLDMGGPPGTERRIVRIRASVR